VYEPEGADMSARPAMITAAQCKSFIIECDAVGTAPDISIRRATAAMAICYALTAVAGHVARYDAIVKEEEKQDI
jgi:hypothetical protein